MKVNHKTFTGGYKFDNFEGQPSKGLTLFKPVSDVTGTVIEPGRGVTAANVLDALSLTDFTGPNSVQESTNDKIAPKMVKDIVVNAVEVEPYTLPVENILNKETIDMFMSGLKEIHKSYFDGINYEAEEKEVLEFTKVIIEILNASQNRMNLAALFDESISSAPASTIG